MSDGECLRIFWALEYINGHQMIGRFDSHWTRGYDLASAALFQTRGEAENALQALRQEASDRCEKQDHSRNSFWYDIYGGLVCIVEVEQLTRIRKENP